MIKFNHRWLVGSKHIGYVGARLFLGEEKKEGALYETASAVDSLDVSKGKKCQDPRLNHDLSEKSEICIPKLEIKFSDDDQKELNEKLGQETPPGGVFF
jgi:hypothetical protein